MIMPCVRESIGFGVLIAADVQACGRTLVLEQYLIPIFLKI